MTNALRVQTGQYRGMRHEKDLRLKTHSLLTDSATSFRFSTPAMSIDIVYGYQFSPDFISCKPV
jgi:hypothetical protein